MRQPHRAVAAALVLLLWLAVLTVAFHGRGSGGFLVTRRTAVPVVAVARKMLLAVTSSSSSFDATAASPTTSHPHGHHHRNHHHRHKSKWNRQGVPPSTAGGGDGQEVDPLYGVQKRLVPSGPNPLHH